ncbi:hypothetical protein K9O30_06105 [Clostridium bowmanii]|uniref:hypothetical protein n=1 Tax=Clostridium bowmanii TaxID=132925 RepID=UPI001C0C4E76|nr:hypothetical protein [Clostridium bowmanii]MBU3188733.1 hypothetical protein [Clostridium bowmanii]MCA1073318.1 hypothetical protein [Clostridium bowmanii]
MENTIKVRNFQIKVKSVFAISLTVVIVSFISLLNYIDKNILTNVLISSTSSSIGICGGYYVSKKIDADNQKIKAVTLKKNMLNLLENEIYENGIIFNEHYNKEKIKAGSLDLKLKNKFKVDVWDKFKFKIFTEGIEILDQDKFTELCELYKRFERLNLQKELNSPVNEISKTDILNYIDGNLMKIENYLRAN